MIKILLLCAILSTFVATHSQCTGMPSSARFEMLEAAKNQGFGRITEHHLRQREFAQAVGEYREMNIFMDMTHLLDHFKGNESKQAYYKKIMEITLAWWRDAVKVNDNRQKIMPEIKEYLSDYPESKKTLNFNFDNSGYNWGDYDLLIKVSWGEPFGADTLAYAGPYLRHPESQRPIVGTTSITLVGDKEFEKQGVDYAIGTMIHEVGHIIGYEGLPEFHPKYVVTSKNTNQFAWIGPKVLEYGKEFYNCESFDGLPIQNSKGEAGAHWSEAFLGPEIMTPIAEVGNPFSYFSLAFLEDTKWYKPNYTYAEKFDFLKDSGCSIKATCPSQPACQIDSDEFIMSSKQGLGWCDKDRVGCAVQVANKEKNCQDGSKWDPQNSQLWGASYGGNCAIVKTVSVWFEDGFQLEQESWLSAQVKCDSTASSYTVTYKGVELNSDAEKTGKDVVVKCDKAGPKEWNESTGSPSITVCENPVSFCAARFNKTIEKNKVLCDSSCNENGRCQDVGNNKPSLKDYVVSQRIRFLRQALAELGEEMVENSSEWLCWCYSNYQRTNGVCPKI